MKILALGDIHGLTIWKDIVAANPDVDKIVFIGDYVDTHQATTPLEQLDNLREIIQFKSNNFGKVILLVGNHDYHYWPGITENYSGYQPQMRQSFEYEYRQYKHLFQMCFLDENLYLYSHAGVTETWLAEVIGIKKEDSLALRVVKINDAFKYQPYKFSFYDGDRSHCGDHIRQSCIWVRPESLWKDKMKGVMEIIGHTTIQKINHPPKAERMGFYDIDCLGTSREYLIIEDGNIIIKQHPK